MQQNNNFI